MSWIDIYDLLQVYNRGSVDAYYKLKEYEDLENQGLLLRLPGKVGDKARDTSYGSPIECIVKGFQFDDKGELYVNYEAGEGYSFWTKAKYFGVSVFTKLEDAENTKTRMRMIDEGCKISDLYKETELDQCLDITKTIRKY